MKYLCRGDDKTSLRTSHRSSSLRPRLADPGQGRHNRHGHQTGRSSPFLLLRCTVDHLGLHPLVEVSTSYSGGRSSVAKQGGLVGSPRHKYLKSQRPTTFLMISEYRTRGGSWTAPGGFWEKGFTYRIFSGISLSSSRTLHLSNLTDFDPTPCSRGDQFGLLINPRTLLVGDSFSRHPRATQWAPEQFQTS